MIIATNSSVLEAQRQETQKPLLLYFPFLALNFGFVTDFFAPRFLYVAILAYLKSPKINFIPIKTVRVSYLSADEMKCLQPITNISAAQYTFDTELIVLLAKTVLEIKHSRYLPPLFGKGYFNPSAVQNIQFEKDFFMLDGVFEKEEREERIVCSLKRGSKKTIKRNGKIYERISDHIGFLPLVIISPADRDLIVEGSATRRKFIDGVMGQTDKAYLKNLLAYNKIIVQRNALLKYFVANQTFDASTLEIYDQQLAQLGTNIHKKRLLLLSSPL